MQIGIKVRTTLKNHLFYQSRIDKGYYNFSEFVKCFNTAYNLKISYNTLSSYENLRSTPIAKTATKLAEFLDIPIEVLFPKEKLERCKKLLKNYNKKMYLIEEAEKLISGHRTEDNLFINDLRETLNKSLKTLDKREQKVIELTFYKNMTLEESGKKLNCSSEKIRQIQNKALRKLRHPNRLKDLKDFLVQK